MTPSNVLLRSNDDGKLSDLALIMLEGGSRMFQAWDESMADVSTLVSAPRSRPTLSCTVPG